jgi:IMP dehydrogenase/GMP reductase
VNISVMDAAQVITGLCSAIAALGGVVVMIRRWVAGIARESQATNAVVQRELTPNHGTSLKDQVARIETVVQAIQLASVERHAENRALIEELTRRFDAHVHGGDR